KNDERSGHRSKPPARKRAQWEVSEGPPGGSRIRALGHGHRAREAVRHEPACDLEAPEGPRARRAHLAGTGRAVPALPARCAPPEGGWLDHDARPARGALEDPGVRATAARRPPATDPARARRHAGAESRANLALSTLRAHARTSSRYRR